MIGLMLQFLISIKIPIYFPLFSFLFWIGKFFEASTEPIFLKTFEQ